ncbi:MAG: helix-turn-helix transcriptional regulator [Clostridia bacterium]|nr:helix-turn-helix transcriptional regulator [Clostridia bacterium]
MSNSVCNFISGEPHSGGIKPVHFVYETDFHSLRQPFFPAVFSVFLVIKGNGILKYPTAFPLNVGDLFFAFPSCRYSLEASPDFEYMYISFLGEGCHALLKELGISAQSPVYHGFEHILDFWKQAIHRKADCHMTLLTESVLLYTLSFIQPETDQANAVSGNTFNRIVAYVDRHFRDPLLSLNTLATEFSYTEKYISSLFTKHMDIPFKRYLNTLRIQYAYTLIDNGETSVAYIAEQCGYSDAVYFTKVFKSRRHMTPTEYIEYKKADV